MKKLWKKIREWFDSWIDYQLRDLVPATEAGEPAEETQEAPQTPAPAAPADTRYPLGIASCWDGDASKRMMNILSPRMSDETFKNRLQFMLDKGCTHAHVILANGGDGEAAGYAAWNDSDRPKMYSRLQAVKAAGLIPVPWIITDDSAALQKELFSNPMQCLLIVGYCGFFEGAPYVVLGLEMDEGGTLAQWKSVREAVREYYAGPIGVHHKSGNSFPFASLGDIVLGQLDPGCTEAQVKAQIKAILAKDKRAVGFEYARRPNRALSLAALEAGAEGCGNWNGGTLPNISTASPGEVGADVDGDAVDFSSLDFCWGSFAGGKAALADARIKGLRVTRDGLSYAWAKGGCESIGATSREDYEHTVVCLFCKIGGKWKGGKFDGISTSRTTRDFRNIHDGYHGWDTGAIEKADAYAFVIVSRDGKKRTNVITQGA